MKTFGSNLLEKIIEQDQELVGNGRWLRGSKNSSLIVDTEKQVFYFNTRDIKGNVIDWLVKIKGFSYQLAKEYINNFQGFLNPLPKTAVSDKVSVPFDKLIDAFHDNLTSDNKNYWYSRGISDTSIDRFRLGTFYDEYFDINWNTIPILLNGKFYNFQLRTDIPDKRIKAYYRGLGPLPFNFDIMSITNSIIVCEGPTDCIRLLQEGVPAVSHTGGATNWMPEWFSYFIRQKNIFVLYDNDEAGERGAVKVANNLGVYRTKIFTFENFNKKGYDIIDFFRDGGKVKELLDLVNNESKYAFFIPERSTNER